MREWGGVKAVAEERRRVRMASFMVAGCLKERSGAWLSCVSNGEITCHTCVTLKGFHVSLIVLSKRCLLY
jgi:hypothetical protein